MWVVIWLMKALTVYFSFELITNVGGRQLNGWNCTCVVIFTIWCGTLTLCAQVSKLFWSGQHEVREKERETGWGGEGGTERDHTDDDSRSDWQVRGGFVYLVAPATCNALKKLYIKCPFLLVLVLNNIQV